MFFHSDCRPAVRLARILTFKLDILFNQPPPRGSGCFLLSINNLKDKAMKEFMQIFVEPFQTKELSRTEKFVLGVVAPAAFVAVVILSHLLP